MSDRAHEGRRLHAYWFWGALPDDAEMCRQLVAFRAAGFGTIYIQARLSMPRETYLSPSYLDAYARAVAHMGRLGLRAGLYDEYCWASGHAGGRVVAGADHLRERHLFWARGDGRAARISGMRAGLGPGLGPAARDWYFEGGAPRFDKWRLVAGTLRHADGRTEDITAELRIVRAGQDGLAVELDRAIPQGAVWHVFASARVCTSRMIDYLSPEAGARFVEVGLDPYARALAGHMPGTLDHVFFDQPAPALYDWPQREGNLRSSLPWSEEFGRRIAERGPLAQHLAALTGDAGAATPALRSTVYRLYAEQFRAAFFGPVRAFCDRHGLALSGHEILPHVGSFDLNGGFSGIDPRPAMGVDFFGTDRWRDRTAVDANNLDAQLSPMLGSSIARAAGRRGCAVELYVTSRRSAARAAGQWEMTPAELRVQMIRLHLLGASDIILHALHAEAGAARESVLDTMRFDFAPGYNLQPWWPVMGDIAEEVAALARFAEGAEPVGQVAILYPYETALVEGPAHAHALIFGAWCRTLFELGHRPLVIDEAGLGQARLSEGDVRIFGSRIAALVLPGVTALHDPRSADRIAAMAAAGVPLRCAPPGPDDAATLVRRAGGPEVAPVPGLRAVTIGRDGAGWWRVVLVNETEAEIEARLRFGAGVSCRIGDDAPSLGAEVAGLRLEAQELACLHVRSADAAQAFARLRPGPRLVPVATLAQGWTLRIGEAASPVDVDVDVGRGWEAQGWADHSGMGRYETEFTLDADRDIVLEMPGLACCATVWLDGHARGRCFRPPFRVALGPVAAGAHRLAIAVANTGANRFYAGTPHGGDHWPDASGLTRPPRLLTPAKEDRA